ncbi:MAG TPA: hypothetical protein VGN69_01955, partial [Solirubrobacteraceae bacterium]|nr:hypothetical protein [Solirubrobacteraceae bacterium]
MAEVTSATKASSNGHRKDVVAKDVRPEGGGSRQRGLLERLARSVASSVQTRIPVADLDERDPD